MGQATVDLPDPQRAPLPSGGADDLLAQMAGAEIDRLLAEADAGRNGQAQPAEPIVYDEAPKENPAAAQSASPALAVASQLNNKNDDAAHASDSAPAAMEASAATSADAQAAPDSDASDEALAGELDALLETLTANDPPAAPPTPAPVPVSQVVAAEEAAAVPAAATAQELPAESAEILAAAEAQVAATGELSTDGVEETSVAERSALAADPGIAEGLTAEIPEDHEYQQFQFLLKPLEWINAPLAACPDLFRELIGKAAILTAVNAAALMVYVHFIRHH